MNPFLSAKFRFYSFLSMVLLVFVHGYNLHDRYMQPWTLVNESLSITTYTEYFLANGIFRFRIPMLFVISGYLFAMHDTTPFKQRLRKRTRTLLLPYFLWSVIGLVLAILLSMWPVMHDSIYKAHLQPSDKPFGEYGLLDWVGAVMWPTSFQLWFLRCLFFYNLIYPYLLKWVIRFPAVVFSILGFLWLTTFGMVILEGEGLLFFTLGIFLCKRQVDIQHTPSWLQKWWGVLFFLLAAVKTWLAFEIKYIDTGTFFLFSFLHKATIIAGLLWVWFYGDTVVNLLMKLKWFQQLTAFSFIIYALHVPIITYAIDPFLLLFSGWPGARLFTFFVLPVVIISFCILTGWMMRRLVPSAYAVLTGGRGL